VHCGRSADPLTVAIHAPIANGSDWKVSGRWRFDAESIGRPQGRPPERPHTRIARVPTSATPR